MKRKQLTLLLVGILTVFSSVGVALIFPWRTHVKLSGIVVDGKNGVPVTGAKVIVALRRKGFPFDGYSAIGTMTDAEGRFSLDLDAPRRFHDIFVEASTPANEYGRISSANDIVTVVTSPLSPALRDAWGFSYTAFRGSFLFGRDPDLHFVDGGWSIDEP